MARVPNDMLHGTLDVLVLKSLSLGPRHGFGIARVIEERTSQVLEIEDAALYKALHRLEASGAVESDWGITENNRRAKYYTLTPAGRRQLKAEAETWQRFASAVFRMLEVV